MISLIQNSLTITSIWNLHWIGTTMDLSLQESTREFKKNGRLIQIAAYNPILDTRMYEVEYSDGLKTEMTANTIASNLFSQVDQDGQHFVLFDAIIDLRTNVTQIKEGETFIHMSNGNKKRIDTNKGW